MNGKMTTFLNLTVILLFRYFFPSMALDLESAKETKCFPIKSTVAVDENWSADPLNPFYYPLQSKYDLYMTSLGISDKSTTDLKEHELFYDSCILISGGKDGFNVTGFGGVGKFYSLKPVNGWEVYQFSSNAEQGFQNVTCYNTLTDNGTFIFTACCDNNNNQMSWGVTASLHILPSETVQQIYDHAESLGFKQEYFTALQYYSCFDLCTTTSSSSSRSSANYLNLILWFLLFVCTFKI